MADALQLVADRIAALADEMGDLFMPGAKVTVVVRHPDVPDAEMIISTDDLLKVVETIQHRLTAPDSIHGKAGGPVAPAKGEIH